MSVSGTGPVNSGSPFRTYQTPFKLTASRSVASPLQQKIEKALSEQDAAFTGMRANELKKRVAFYARFEGTKIGAYALNDVATQIGRMLSQNGWEA